MGQAHINRSRSYPSPCSIASRPWSAFTRPTAGEARWLRCGCLLCLAGMVCKERIALGETDANAGEDQRALWNFAMVGVPRGRSCNGSCLDRLHQGWRLWADVALQSPSGAPSGARRPTAKGW